MPFRLITKHNKYNDSINSIPARLIAFSSGSWDYQLLTINNEDAEEENEEDL